MTVFKAFIWALLIGQGLLLGLNLYMVYYGLGNQAWVACVNVLGITGCVALLLSIQRKERWA